MEGIMMYTAYALDSKETTVFFRDKKNINLPCLVHELVHVSQILFKRHLIRQEEIEHQAYIVQYLLNEWIIKSGKSTKVSI